MNTSRIKLTFFIASVFLLFALNLQAKETNGKQPNIVIIYLDDLGYGDVSAYGATKITTPNIDKLAHGGIRFTDGHATSATCTPSRYGLLTGVYPWRNKKARILKGDAPMLIDTQQITLPKLLKQQGYHTGIVGKWHLGLGNGQINWNKHISPSPNDVGFNYSHILAATQDRVPTVYIENGSVVNLDTNDPIQVNYRHNFEGEPTALSHPELCTYVKWHHGHNNSVVNGIPRIGFMKGGEAAKWKDTEMADHFLKKAQDYVVAHKNQPFFLYYAMQQPHVPRTPHPRFAGKSGMGPRGDVILEADWCIGQFIKTLEDEGLLKNTLIIFSSDNGPVLNDGYFDEAVEKQGKHQPTGQLRGGKYSLFEAGTRVPFITYWQGKITPAVSDALICQIDILASVSQLVGSKTMNTDSQNLLNLLLGKSNTGRQDLILEAMSKTAYRNGQWLLIPPYPGTSLIKSVNIETGNSEEYQLYNLTTDLEQRNNLASSHKKQLKKMIKLYQKNKNNKTQE